MKKWCDKSVLVLGLGETGMSLVRWLSAQGAKVQVADSRATPPGVREIQESYPQVGIHCGAFSNELLAGIELIAISPGVPLAESFVQHALAQQIPVVGDIELFAQALPQNNPPKIIAITGANGKTTVTTLVGEMCRAAGLDVEVAGNISPAVLDVWLQRQGKQPAVWVLELSSFQLETTSTLKPDAATVLNISEDHLDRYDGMADYIAAKARIFAAENSHGVQVLNRDDAASLAMSLRARPLRTFGLDALPVTGNNLGIVREGEEIWLMEGAQRLVKASELPLVGLHNVANALAAIALCRAIALPMAPLLVALKNFKGLPHRVEKVADINGVIYYDDSKGTNVGATEAALKGLGRPAVVILGGEGKGQDFSPLGAAVKQHARAAVLIGRDADIIAHALHDSGVPILRASDMSSAVKIAAEQAQSGDAVLLSPACASFDMFKNYQHRAEQFIAAVRDLERGAQ